MTQQFLKEGPTRMCLVGSTTRLSLEFVILALGCGCLSLGTVQTADTVGKGIFQFSAEPGAYGFGTGNAKTNTQPLPDFDVAFRYGVSEHVDLGVRFGGTLLELQTKFLFTNPENRRLAISLAPTLGGAGALAGGVTYTFFNLAVTLLIGIKNFDGNELVFGPRVNNLLLTSTDSSGSTFGYVLGVGGSVGYCFAIGRLFKILPEFAISQAVPLPVARPSGPAAGTGYTGVVFQLKIGLMFGRSKHSAADDEP